MSELSLLIEKVDSLKSELEQLRPLKKEDKERLDKKFRLEWNYNSNHIEGNTLTYGQTELLLIFEKTTGDHEMREYEEMQAHDVAIKLVNEYANDKTRDLTEADIREWNKIILVKPFWGNAQTADGQPTRKLIQPGEYKKEPNSVRLQNGEMFHYASPEETPAKMNDLLVWLRKVTTEKKLHPVQIAAQLHYDFVRIHPFDDCNGRTSRLLMNYVLIQNGFPPVIIKSADKKGYLNALNKADVGDVNAFIEYVANELIWSLEIFVKAAKGGSIEEEDDLYKEINVWKKGLAPAKQEHIKSLKIVRTLFDEVLMRLIGFYLIRQEESFDDQFVKNNRRLESDGNKTFESFNPADLEIIFENYASNRNAFFTSENTNTWKIFYYRSTLKDPSKERIDITSTLRIDFTPLTYLISHNDRQLIASPYSHFLSEKEIDGIVKRCIKDTFEEIKRVLGDN
jgi:Fic family protein